MAKQVRDCVYKYSIVSFVSKEAVDVNKRKQVLTLIRTDLSQNFCFGYYWYHKGFRALNNLPLDNNH